MSIKSEIIETSAEAHKVMAAQNDVIPFAGAVIGVTAGFAFLQENFDSTDNSSRIPRLQYQVAELQEAKVNLNGTPQAIRIATTLINETIDQKHTEIKQGAHHPVSAAEGYGALFGGAALGAVLFAAIGARVRLAKRRRGRPAASA